MNEPRSDAAPGRLINRRHALALLGGAGVSAVVMAACGSDGTTGDGPGASGAGSSTTSIPTEAVATTPSGVVGIDAFADAASCTVTPQQTLGPYYIDIDSIRTDIREDRQGVPLQLGIRVLDADGCTPVRDAAVELWHADAGGLYSGFEASSRGQGGGPSVTDEKRYLRGAQITNADGIVEMVTIYPGWYRGRTVHIHAKVQLSNRELLVTQLYFDDDITDQVFTAAPYDERGDRSTRNDDDGIFRSGPTISVSQTADGYLGLITIGVQA